MLAAEVAELKTRQTTWEKIVARLPHFSGYLQPGFEWSNTSSSFFIKRVRLSLTGNISPKFDYKIQMEFVKMQFLDAYIQYKPLRELNFRVGQFSIPFTIENTDYSPLTTELIDLPLTVKRLSGYDDLVGVTSVGRDRGFSTFGGFFHREGYDIVKYEFALFNGEGIDAWDRNGHKDIVARLSIVPVRGLTLSGAYYDGEFGADRITRIRYAAGGDYNRGRLIARGEWIGGRTGNKTGGMKSAGWYLMGGYRVLKNFAILARYDTLQENIADEATQQTNYTAGLLWVPYKFLRCQLNYTFEKHGKPDVANRNVIAVQLTGSF